MTRTVLDMEIPGKRHMQRQAPHQMDGQYQERHETTWPIYESMTEDRKVWSTMVAKVDTR